MCVRVFYLNTDAGMCKYYLRDRNEHLTINNCIDKNSNVSAVCIFGYYSYINVYKRSRFTILSSYIPIYSRSLYTSIKKVFVFEALKYFASILVFLTIQK